MTIKIVFRDGLFCPVVQCDQCGRFIDDAKTGVYEWRDGAKESDVTFLHRACVMAYQENRPWQSSDGLEYFALRLAANMGQSLDDVIAEARELAAWEESPR
jgi:hypothetical protein